MLLAQITDAGLDSLSGGLGLTGHGLDRLADQVADADAGADGAEAVADGREAGVGDLCEEHGSLSSDWWV